MSLISNWCDLTQMQKQFPKSIFDQSKLASNAENEVIEKIFSSATHFVTNMKHHIMVAHIYNNMHCIRKLDYISLFKIRKAIIPIWKSLFLFWGKSSISITLSFLPKQQHPFALRDNGPFRNRVCLIRVMPWGSWVKFRQWRSSIWIRIVKIMKVSWFWGISISLFSCISNNLLTNYPDFDQCNHLMITNTRCPSWSMFCHTLISSDNPHQSFSSHPSKHAAVLPLLT